MRTFRVLTVLRPLVLYLSVIILPVSLSGRAALAAALPVTVEGTAVRVETRTLSALFERGVLASLVRKSDSQELVKADPARLQAVQLIYSGGEAAPLGAAPGDSVLCLQLGPNLAHVRIQSWYGDAVIAVSTDPENGDLIVEPSGYASRPGLRACRWALGGIADGLELIAPVFQGIRAPLDDPLVAGKRIAWPHSWEAGLAILQGDKGGFWVHCRDNRYRFKALQVGLKDEPRGLGLESEAAGPLDDNMAAGGLAWRINVYTGGWEVPAAQYRTWLAAAFGLENKTRPAWVDSLRLAISWAPTEPALLDALAKRVKPSRVLLHLPNWRTDGYDENYPNFKPSPEGAEFVRKARAMGFHVMPHFNSIDMDPSNPAYLYVRDFVYRDPESKKVQGWAWLDNHGMPVPESNAARMKHRRENAMVKVHPGLAMWRSILAENVQSAARQLSLEVAFLDVTLCCWNIDHAVLENVTTPEGMKRIEALIGSLDQGLVIGGEGRNEITMQAQELSQVHLFESWQTNVEGLEHLKPCPVSEFLFGRWSRSFGYSSLSGGTPAEQLRLKIHHELGAIATLTVDSAAEITNPNSAVEAILKQAGR